MTSIIDNTLNKHSADTYTLRPAALEDAYEIWTVMDICFQALEHKEYFICDDLDYVKDILSGHGFGVVACDSEGNTVGNLLVKYPGLDEENLGYDVFVTVDKHNLFPAIPDFNNITLSPDSLNFSQSILHNIPLTSENLNRVLHMDSASVHPNHRGHGLESRMIDFTETLVDTSKYCYSFATVAPKNFASLKSFERNGYQVILTKEKYGGLIRHVMLKTLFHFGA